MKNRFLKSIYFPKTYVVEPEFHSPTRKNVKKKTIKYEATGRELFNMQGEKQKRLEAEGEEFNFGSRPPLTKKERTVEREIEYINLYSKGLKIEFKPGLNLIVGENGSGKSTLISIIHGYMRIGYKSPEDNWAHEFAVALHGEDAVKKEPEKPNGIYKDNWDREVHLDIQNLSLNNFCGWDFEKDNPMHNEKLKPIGGEDSKVVMQKMAFLWSVSEESHGETNRASLDMFVGSKNRLIVFDEPESAISLQGQYEYWAKLMKLAEDNQVIMVTHSKVFMEEAKEVFDMEVRKWVKSEQYFKKVKHKAIKKQ